MGKTKLVIIVENGIANISCEINGIATITSVPIEEMEFVDNLSDGIAQAIDTTQKILPASIPIFEQKKDVKPAKKPKQGSPKKKTSKAKKTKAKSKPAPKPEPQKVIPHEKLAKHQGWTVDIEDSLVATKLQPLFREWKTAQQEAS